MDDEKSHEISIIPLGIQEDAVFFVFADQIDRFVKASLIEKVSKMRKSNWIIYPQFSRVKNYQRNLWSIITWFIC